MNASELIEKWPGWAGADAATVLGSPAWAVPVSFRGEDATLVGDATRERDVIGIEIAFDDEPHFLAVAASDEYPELRKVWELRTKLPDEVLLALVEKECGALFQLLENAVGRQLSVKGLADRETAGARNAAARAFAVKNGDGGTVCDFSLSADGLVLSGFGRLANLDLSHEAIRTLTRPGRVEYAALALDAADAAGLAPGDHLLLPEVGSQPAKWAIEPPADDRLHVLSAEMTDLTFGDLADETTPEPPEASALILVRGEDEIATGRLVRLGELPAFAIEGVR